MKTRLIALSIGLVGFASGLRAAAPTSPLVTKSPDALVAVLQSAGSSRKDKADACRELAVIGDRKAVPVLVPLLADEEFSHMARYALETMRGAEVDTALRNELPKLKGRLLVGVIGSLGVRKDAKAVKPLSQLLGDYDPQVAQAAARALGSIGDTAGARAIEAALPKTSPANQLAFYEGLFRCAESFAAQAKTKDAIALYDRLLKLGDVPDQVRAGALRGSIVTQGRNGLAQLKESLESNNGVIFTAAVRAALDMAEPEAARVLIGCLPRLQPDNQIVVMQALGSLGDSLAVPPLYVLAKAGEINLRLEAINALAAIGQATVVPALVGLLADADREIAQAALDGLAGIPGRDADAAVIALAKSSKSEQRITGINLIGRRRMQSATPTLLAAASDPDAKVRASALQRLERLATPAAVPALIKLLLNSTSPQDLSGLSDALGGICSRAGSPASATEQVVGALPTAQPAQKVALLAVLGAVGGDKALASVRNALNDPQTEVRTAALQALAGWPDAAALPDLQRILRSGANNADRSTAFHGYVRLARESGASADEKLKQLTEAATLAKSTQEKNLVLAGLGDVISVDSLKLAASHLSEAAVADEAGAVTVQIAEKLDAKYATDIGPALNEVLKSAKSSQVQESARKRLEQLKLPIQ